MPPRRRPTPDSHATPAVDATYRPELLDGLDGQERVLTPADAVDYVARTVQTAHSPQWWLLLLDDDGTVCPQIIQIEMPRRFGECEAHQLAGFLGHLLARECGGLVIVWEQPGIEDPTELIGPSLLHSALAQAGDHALAQVLVLPGFRVTAWEPAPASA